MSVEDAGVTAAKKAASGAGPDVQAFMQAFAVTLVQAIRDAVQPEPPPKIEVVTVGTPTGDPKLERLMFCPDCLDRRTGPAWGTHNNVRVIEDPERPGQPKLIPMPHPHPHVPKTISYDVAAVRERMEKRPESFKQCMQCGARLALAMTG